MRMSLDDVKRKLGPLAESHWEAKDLKKNGWELNVDPSSLFQLENAIYMEPVFEDLGVTQESGPGTPNTVVIYEHEYALNENGEQLFTVHEGKQKPLVASHAEYMNVYNPTQGFICAVNNNCPDHKCIGRPDRVLPTPKNWSHFAFRAWEDISKQDKVPLKVPKHVLRLGIINNDTIRIAVEAQRKIAPDFKAKHSYWAAAEITEHWPGRLFKPDSEEGKALLGSPNGLGVAWLLIQHKQQFGVCCVDEIRFFKTASGMHMLLKIAAV
jgi:hypothetical protein